uniref:Uncharacterized protein n=1 Tax=Cacopsylla melanoneura TaxID=428564 RepID=A0A8D9AEH6_9HEMI
MGCLFLTVVLVSCVHVLKAHQYHHEHCKRSFREDNRGKKIVMGPALMNEDLLWQDSLHRVRRETNSNNNTTVRETISKRNTASSKRNTSTISKKNKSTIIKTGNWNYKRKRVTARTGNYGWSEERKKKWSKYMANQTKSYWNKLKEEGKTERHENHRNLFNTFWGKKKQGRLDLRKTMKDYHRRQKEAGNTEIYLRHSQYMKEYWRKKKEEGNTYMFKRHSEFMKALWARLKAEGIPYKKTTDKARTKTPRKFKQKHVEVLDGYEELSETMKEYWAKQQGKDITKKEMGELMEHYRRIQRENILSHKKD